MCFIKQFGNEALGLFLLFSWKPICPKSVWQFTEIVFWELIFRELDCFQAIQLKNKNIYPSSSGISMVPEYKEELLRALGGEYLFLPTMRSFMFLVCYMNFFFFAPCGSPPPTSVTLMHPSKKIWKKRDNIKNRKPASFHTFYILFSNLFFLCISFSYLFVNHSEQD